MPVFVNAIAVRGWQILFRTDFVIAVSQNPLLYSTSKRVMRINPSQQLLYLPAASARNLLKLTSIASVPLPKADGKLLSGFFCRAQCDGIFENRSGETASISSVL